MGLHGIKMVSHWLAWISFGFSILLLLKFVARKSKIKIFNKVLRKSHTIFSIIMIITGLTHGIFFLFKCRCQTLAIITGFVLFCSALFICYSYINRHHHKKTWIKMHRIGSIVFVLLLVVHLIFALMI